ncbi:hypothetical protein IMPR6_80039 [Imperialibacter sp. EC-SDR9]|nr:hypothetical protein IMPERIA75_200039 [Imperialibacter sp. 75]CAD5262295.1 hypothetical protein IMPERIA89_290039 [Imperialibacter sp. 89]VVT35225.1 hypothetical protein IMPR6_80039 [Imperialibacter sp. EC-SDR9]
MDDVNKFPCSTLSSRQIPACDTLLVEVDLGFYVKKKVRLARINAPELTANALAGSHPTSCAWAKVPPRRFASGFTNTEVKTRPLRPLPG